MTERGLGRNYGVQPLDVAVTIILNFSRIILEKLKSKVNQWSSSQLIGDVFIYMSDFLKIYTQYVQVRSSSLLFSSSSSSLLYGSSMRSSSMHSNNIMYGDVN